MDEISQIISGVMKESTDMACRETTKKEAVIELLKTAAKQRLNSGSF
jgi:hypothetical protein